MKTFLLLVASLATALTGRWAFDQIWTFFISADRIGYSQAAGELQEIYFFYAFGYVLVYAMAWFFRWPVSAQRLAVVAAITLLGSVVPLLAEHFHYYFHSGWTLAKIFEGEWNALASLFVSHAVLLLLLNGPFYFRPARRPAAARPVPA